MIKKTHIFFLFLLGYITSAIPAFADVMPSGIRNPAIDKQLGGDTVAAANGTTFTFYFVLIWRALIVVGGLTVLFNLVNGAIDWISAGGEQEKVAKGRHKMTNAIVGMVILVGSFALISFISDLFKLNLLKFTLPTPSNP